MGRKLQAACQGSGICKLFEKESETTLHAVRECQATQEVLTFSGLGDKLPQGPFVSCKSWLEEVLQKHMGPPEPTYPDKAGFRLRSTYGSRITGSLGSLLPTATWISRATLAET
ncbi:hypothetical protein V6N13_130090 [Hibiscus sabdariffa]|uniref:Uncharacterized protein n=1 Tax=Hibiscus sabdariffa TaxID=183260 RepID=A0ABR2SN28_9ROSI